LGSTSTPLDDPVILRNTPYPGEAMKDFNKKVVVVTGASSGIGEALALAFAREGATLVLTARDAERLAAVEKQCRAAGAEAWTQRADVTDEAQVQALAQAVAGRHGAADLLVNNAGVVMSGLVVDVEAADWIRLHQINVMGVVHGCRAFLPRMIERGQGGHVVNMASAAGLVGLSGMGTYSATKFALVGLSESLRAEMRRHRIGVSVICPSYVKTPIEGKVKIVGALDNERTRARIAQTFAKNSVTAEHVAARTLDAIRQDRAVTPVGRDAKLGYAFKRLAPGLLARVMG
jgi:short-subunit dehydrogenase